MKIEYERACQVAGLPEEKIKEIRRMFDADYKRLKRLKKSMENEEHRVYSLEFLKSSENGSGFYDALDPDMDVEKMVLYRLDLERMMEILSRIPQSERDFILDCFEAEWGARKEIAEKYALTVEAVKHKKKRIIKKLKKMFFDDMELNS